MPIQQTAPERALAGHNGAPDTAAAPLPPATAAPGQLPHQTGTVLSMIGAVSVSHLLNDLIQSTLPAIYPMLKSQFALSFGQVGMITAMFQLTASLLQPWVGLYTDRHPKPYLLPIGTIATLVGLLALSIAPSFPMLLAAAALIGIGSSTFHPEASRVARLASGGRYGLAQSLFQVGGNAGSALGPALAAAIIMPRGQGSIAWFAVFAVIAIAILTRVSRWYQNHLQALQAKKARSAGHGLTRRQVAAALIVLGVLVFSKYFYMASLTSYYTFYLISRFGLSVQSAQLHLFLFLAAVAVGTLVGGPIGDRIGRKYVIWVSILGVAPFTLALPYANLFWTGVLSVVIGLVLASAFSAIVVFAQELVPGRVGMVAGVFFGLMFGISGIGAALLGHLADTTSIAFVYKVCSFLPLIGVLTVLLPNMEKLSKGR